jgi:hypothetical protein
MEWYKIKDNETLELFIVNSDEQPENSVLVTAENSNFIKPIANSIVFTEVVEGITPEEIAESLEKKQQRYFNEIYRRKSLLDLSILRRALGKENPIYNGLQKSDFETLKNNYFHKNEVASAYLNNGTIINQSLFDLMNNIECEIDFEGTKLDDEVLMLNTDLIPFLGALTGQTIDTIPTENITRIQKYMHIVSVKYIYGSFIFDFLNDFSEVFRSLSITRLDLNQFEKIDAGFELLTDLGSKTISEIITLKTTFVNL